MPHVGWVISIVSELLSASVRDRWFCDVEVYAGPYVTPSSVAASQTSSPFGLTFNVPTIFALVA